MKNNTLFAGVDLHKKFSVVTILNKEGDMIKQEKIENKEEKLFEFFDQFDQPMEIAIETTFNSYWFCHLMESEKRKVCIGNSRKVKAIGINGAKTDKIDSKVLADLLRTNFFPASYKFTTNDMERKELVRLRLFFTKQRSQTKNKIHSYLLRFNIKHPFSDLFTKKGLNWLKENLNRLPIFYRKSVRECLSHYHYLEKKINKITRRIKKEHGEVPEIKLLQTIRGIGLYTAVLLFGEIGDINRFSDPKKLCKYFGIVPRVYQSAERVRFGRLTKDGSKYVRWALTESVQKLENHDSQLGKQYRRIKKKKEKNIAVIVTMRKLVTIIYRCLTTGEIYEPYPSNA